LVVEELVFLVVFFFGDPRVVFVVFGDFGDLDFGDSTFFEGDLVAFGFSALTFFGDVASFLGTDVVVFLVVDGETFFTTFFGDVVVVFLAFVVDFFEGDLAVFVDDFFELDVDLFFGDEVVKDVD